MVFSSPLFVFLFLPSVILACLFFRNRLSIQNGILLFASLLFYAWGEAAYVFLIICSVIFNYLAGLLIHASRPAFARSVLTVSVAGNLLLLGTYKYANYFYDSISLLLDAEWPTLQPVHLPIGISFFTFQAISYLVDVYRKQTQVLRNPFYLGLYISLFPQLLAGPIVRYNHIATQITNRSIRLEDFSEGLVRFCFGLAKKVLVADSVGGLVQEAFGAHPGSLTPSLAWCGLIAFTIQIYFDFSGYSDMAIGLGRVFGFRFRENFDYPYISRSVTEFWRRWHISLSSWFRDYLYIPLGGNRAGRLRTYFNLWAVFLLCGLWHGASSNFLAWGVFHGTFLVIERGRLGRIIRGLPRPLAHIYLMSVVAVGWVIFRAKNLSEAINYLSTMFSPLFGAAFGSLDSTLVDNQILLVAFLGVILSTPAPVRRYAALSASARTSVRYLTCAIPLLLLAASMVSIAATTFRPFLYFRF